jgi:hypothetical protein
LKNFILFYAIKDYIKFPFISEILTDNIVLKVISIILTIKEKFNFENIFGLAIFINYKIPFIYFHEKSDSYFKLVKNDYRFIS